MDQRRLAPSAGMIGPALFMATFTIEGWLRPAYHAKGMYISALSLGPRGCIQIANFVVFGALFLAFARGVAAAFPNGKASRSGPILLTIIGLGFLLSGPFVMDPVNTLPRAMTLHGVLHSLFGALVFALSPVTCFVFARRFRDDPRWRSLRPWTLAVGTNMALAVVLMKIAQGRPPVSPNALSAWIGLIQRFALVPYLIWILIFAAYLHRAGTHATGVAPVGDDS